ncbi:MAG: hypothetical protein M3Y22_10360 [Pseudomonadota bacterium]|nr:hypothetical protein [Pseudomonadota bacterium]
MKLDTFKVRWLRQSFLSVFKVQRSDLREFEQAFSVGFCIASQLRDLRQSCSNKRHRQLLLHRFVNRLNYGFELRLAEELNFVKQ